MYYEKLPDPGSKLEVSANECAEGYYGKYKMWLTCKLVARNVLQDLEHDGK